MIRQGNDGVQAPGQAASIGLTAAGPRLVEDPAGQRWLVALVCAGAFIANLDATIVNIALPTVARDFQVSPSSISWVCLACLLCETGFLLPFGKLADMKGGRPVYLGGFLLFLTGSAQGTQATDSGPPGSWPGSSVIG